MSLLVYSNILLWCILFASLALAYHKLKRGHNVLFFWREAPKKSEEGEEVTVKTINKAVHQALHSLNVNYDHEENNDRNLFHLKYQNGHFLIIVPSESPDHIRILFPVIATTETDKISLARTICNEINCNSILVTALYNVDTSEDSVCINLTASIPATNDSDIIAKNFDRIVNECFFIQRQATVRLNEYIQKAAHLDTNDPEYNDSRESSLNYLLLESEYDYDCSNFHLKTNREQDAGPLTIGDLIDSEAFSPVDHVTALEVKGTGLDLLITNIDEIKAFPIDFALTDDKDNPQQFVRDNACLTLRYYTLNDTDTSSMEHTVLIYLHTIRAAADALYYRLTFLMPDRLTTVYHNELETEGKKTPTCGSLLLARDLKDKSQYRAEFKYVWGELSDKIESGRELDLNDRERLLHHAKNPDDGYLLFQANRLMRQHRYTEALEYLEHLWHNVNCPDLLVLKEHSERMDYVAYLRGTCHLKLGEYEKAFFYLRMISHKGVIAYYRQYLNCMIACAHPYALEEVEGALKQTNEKIEEMKDRDIDVPDEVASFHHFLKRRLVFLHIALHHFQTAEDFLLQLKDEPENIDFALKQLARIEEIKRRNESKDDNLQ